ncbi:MAG: isoamylase early set domain-containing protein [Deltaproteobacteria bacterium]|nr:isoamylase early set domain-containing protein [Candidatus Anaeroferrophillus wilburensis]MBN2888578.1 isoamylase early set domain-containing protein [Deltaproteobacteria bacterium]
MIRKSYSKTGRVCRVTFRLPAEVGAATAALCGEFNDWDVAANPMKCLSDGCFSITISLAAGHNYRFRYLLDGDRWENDGQADGYVFNVFGSEDFIVGV